MIGGLSNGMLLAASDKENGILAVISPEKDLPPGAKVS
ncbi:MAG: hypothetical protein Q8Q32_02325 [bacterium]|nr:hypothetical protein [bacterium]